MLALENPRISGEVRLGVVDAKDVAFRVAVTERQPLLLQGMSLEEGNCAVAETEELNIDGSV